MLQFDPPTREVMWKVSEIAGVFKNSLFTVFFLNKFYTDDEKEFMAAQNDTATRSSVIVKFKGNLEVTLTPLLLEGLQR